MKGARVVAAAAIAALLVSCTGAGPLPQAAGPTPLSGTLDPGANRWVNETVAGMTLREAVAQLVIPWIPGGYASESDPDFRELLGWVEEGLGGVSISIGVPDAYVAKLNRLQSRARIPLLVTSDFENGGPGMRINHSYAIPSLLPQGGGTSFPPTMAFGAARDEDLAFEYGRITALEARAVGVHWLFAPVLDVNSNPDNPVINVRSFGEDPEAVGRLGAAFIRGAREGGALTTAKHFPGHGDTRTDSHIELPVIGADRDRLDRVELVPFRMAIDAGVDAVMTAHVAVPGVLGDDRPATMSSRLMTDLLRGEMGFGGLLFTDALRMGAITDGYGAGEAAVLALEAGSDVLLAPDGIGATIDAVTAAVQSGRVTRERIDASVRRLLEAKARLGLHLDGGRADPRAVAERVGTAEHRAVAERAAAASLTLVRDRDRVVPLAPRVEGAERHLRASRRPSGGQDLRRRVARAFRGPLDRPGRPGHALGGVRLAPVRRAHCGRRRPGGLRPSPLGRGFGRGPRGLPCLRRGAAPGRGHPRRGPLLRQPVPAVGLPGRGDLPRGLGGVGSVAAGRRHGRHRRGPDHGAPADFDSAASRGR